jgi:hypothetical protein
MCPACWDLRATAVQPQKRISGTRLQTAGLVLGLFALLPLWPVWLASFVVNIVAIAKASQPPARAVRWRPIVGLTVTCLGGLVWLTVIVAAALRH